MSHSNANSAGYPRDLCRGALDGWNRFWFSPADPATFSMIRVLAGLMLFYTHLVWTIELEAFFGAAPWLSAQALAVNIEPSPWSYFWLIDSPAMLWTAHIAALVVIAMLTIGLFSRVTSVLTFVITVSYALRVPGALFGLDQINALLAMYLMLGPSGACYSVDRWWARRRGRADNATAPSIGANVGIRLMQVHMCVIYLFSGLGKLQGDTWWDGSAMWGAVASLEYQSMDLTWMASWPLLVSFLTHLTVWWEVSYSALVWPRLTRGLVILVAIPLHLGIALGLGMITFGLAMLIGNAAFVSPALTRKLVDKASAPLRPLVGRKRSS